MQNDTRIFISGLFMVARDWKQPNMPISRVCVWGVSSMGYDAALINYEAALILKDIKLYFKRKK